MLTQIKLLLLLVNLFIGFGVVSFLYLRIRLYGSFYLRVILKYTIIINVVLFFTFLSIYFNINIWGRDLHFDNNEYLPYLFSIIYFSIFLLISTMYEIYSAFLNRKLHKRQVILQYLFLIIFTSIVFISSKLSIGNSHLNWILYFFDNFGLILPLAEISILINLYFRAVKLKSAQKLIRSFAFLYLIRYPFLIFAFLIPEPIRMFSVVLILNAIPVFWIKLYVDKAEIVSFNLENRNEAIEKITTDYKISTRETEILKLVLNGKNNKQIEQELFISYHTVKNHIYNIFQKLGISNRYQLISLIDNIKYRREL